MIHLIKKRCEKMEKCLFDNGIFEYLEVEEEIKVNNTTKKIKRKVVRRPPGIRALIINDKKEILLSHEFRYELKDWDFRLPGGKVFDTLEEFKESLKNNNIDEAANKTVYKEVLEEVGIDIYNPKLIKISKDGASVIWDLYYYEITDFKINKDGSHLEEEEIIDGYVWKSFAEVIKLCQEGAIHEDRSVGVLLTYILKNQ